MELGACNFDSARATHIDDYKLQARRGPYEKLRVPGSKLNKRRLSTDKRNVVANCCVKLGVMKRAKHIQLIRRADQYLGGRRSP
jgi:hypothetical protein